MDCSTPNGDGRRADALRLQSSNERNNEMIRNLKVLGLAFAAVFALSAVMASGAMANKLFTSPESTGTTYLTGEQHAGDDIFTTDSGTVTCGTATYSGSVAGTSSATVTVTPTYSNCHLIFIFTFNVTVDVNGCGYVFSIEAGANENNEGATQIECPAGAVIEVTAPGCTVTVPPQSNLVKVTYTNKGNAVPAKEMDVTVDVGITGITYEEHNTSGSTCASSTTHTTNGTYEGAATVRGYSSPTTHNSTTQTSVTVD
jgi:hypothetical protein